MTQSASHAVVVGAGIAGLLSARVLAESFDSVTVLERDRLPGHPTYRKGVPQGRHLHQFLTRGTQVLDELLPGVLSELAAAGAIVNDPSRVYAQVGRHHLNSAGRLDDPWALTYYQASRPFVEFHIRRRLEAIDNITFLDGHEAVDLVTSDGAVTGIHVTNRDSGDPTTLVADLVVDATGRATHTPALLERNGFSSPPEKRAAANWAYSGQLLHIPAGRITPQMVSMLDQGQRSTRLLLLAYEHNTWILAVGEVTQHAPPPTDYAQLLVAAEQIVPGTVMAGLRTATPIGDIAIFRNTAAVWRRYDQMTQLPAGVLVIGDALCTLDPIWGQGMTMAAVQALALRNCLREGTTDLPRRFFTATVPHIRSAWAMNQHNDRTALAADTRFPLRRRIGQWITNAALQAAATDTTITERLFRVANLVDPPRRLQDPALIPRIAIANLRRPLRQRRTNRSTHAR